MEGWCGVWPLIDRCLITPLFAPLLLLTYRHIPDVGVSVQVGEREGGRASGGEKALGRAGGKVG